MLKIEIIESEDRFARGDYRVKAAQCSSGEGFCYILLVNGRVVPSNSSNGEHGPFPTCDSAYQAAINPLEAIEPLKQALVPLAG